MFLFYFFKQKTAYEMRISDWSSDVCSSDLHIVGGPCLRQRPGLAEAGDRAVDQPGIDRPHVLPPQLQALDDAAAEVLHEDVGPADEVEGDGPVLLLLEVEDHVALVDVEADEVGSHDALQGQNPSRAVAGGRLDLAYLDRKSKRLNSSQ